LVIKVLRTKGVNARRVYLYQSRATNHVLFEYEDPQLHKWIIMDSYASSEYLRDFLNQQALSPAELLQRADPRKLVYDKFGYLPKQLFFALGERFSRSIPYAITWWFEEVFLIKAVGFALLAALAATLWFRAGRHVSLDTLEFRR
jgi:AAA+ ATPase superfamily predicted ATPase